MMSPEDQLDELLAEITSLYQRAKGGERGRQIAREVRNLRNNLENIEEALEDDPQSRAV